MEVRVSEVLKEAKYYVLDIARFTINYCYDNDIFLNSFMLQKILYYIQAAYSANNEIGYIGRSVKKDLGPVVPTIGDIYDRFGSNQIPKGAEPHKEIEEKDKELIADVIESCTEYNQMGLSAETHKDEPWQKTDNGKVIDIDLMSDFYSSHRERLMISENK